ncbi:prephenate dehydratase [Candidatus Bipolaricaulota bacterium]|nr:prephenate dehydratase [Candidatus Bipolaricaulota bacterium]
MNRVAFQGVTGAYSAEAIDRFFGSEIDSLPCRTLLDLFLTVERGDADYGMLPIENAVAGSVTAAYELLMEHDLRIYAEVILHVRHMLVALPGTKLADLKRVRSHPQALAQCQRYLARHQLEPEPTIDTSGSAHDLAKNPEPGVAVIAGEAAAKLCDLEIIDRGIEDFPFNYTRFFVLSLEDPPRAQRNKTSLVFTTPHRPGVLYECLGEFARRRISLAKIESRPRLNRPWQYIFYLDFEGHCRDPECEAAIMGLLRRSSFVKMLGSYPAATTPLLDSRGDS